MFRIFHSLPFIVIWIFFYKFLFWKCAKNFSFYYYYLNSVWVEKKKKINWRRSFDHTRKKHFLLLCVDSLCRLVSHRTNITIVKLPSFGIGIQLNRAIPWMRMSLSFSLGASFRFITSFEHFYSHIQSPPITQSYYISFHISFVFFYFSTTNELHMCTYTQHALRSMTKLCKCIWVIGLHRHVWYEFLLALMVIMIVWSNIPWAMRFCIADIIYSIPENYWTTVSHQIEHSYHINYTEN